MIMDRIFKEVEEVKRDFCMKLKSEAVCSIIETPGLDLSKILFADDTLIFAEQSASLEAILWAIESVSAAYGLGLNRDKCVLISSGLASSENPLSGWHTGTTRKRNTLEAS